MGWWLQEEILQCKAQIWVVHKLWQMMRKQSAKMDIRTHVAKKKITNNVKRKTDRFVLANLYFRVATVNPQAACRPYHLHHGDGDDIARQLQFSEEEEETWRAL
jgi:hypothetical protein